MVDMVSLELTYHPAARDSPAERMKGVLIQGILLN